MIGSLRGKVIFLGSESCIIDTVGGVGYLVYMPSSHLAELSIGKEAFLFIHTAVREDAITLYGFLSREYYEFYQLIVSITSIGPKIALGVLSQATPTDFYKAVKKRDVRWLTKLPGIGKKTAERILLEIKDKVDGLNMVDEEENARAVSESSNDAIGDAEEALLSLGYKAGEISPVLKEIDNINNLRSEEILRLALRIIANNKLK